MTMTRIQSTRALAAHERDIAETVEHPRAPFFVEAICVDPAGWAFRSMPEPLHVALRTVGDFLPSTVRDARVSVDLTGWRDR